jgi:hypothetical protein
MRFSLGLVTSILAWSANAATESPLYPRQSNETGYKLGYTPLKTDWTDTVGTNPWPQHPRPRLQRPNWKNLNGVWGYRNTTNGSDASPPFGQKLDNTVLVPFCLESALSGKPTRVSDWARC